MRIIFKEKSSDKTAVNVVFAEQKADELICKADGSKELLISMPSQKIDHRKFLLLCRKVIALARKNNVKKLAVNFSATNFAGLKNDENRRAETMATEFELANYEFVKYKTPPKEGWNFMQELIITGRISNEIKKAFGRGQLIGQWTNKSRDLSNTPGGGMTPQVLVNEIKKFAKGTKVKVTILDEKKIFKLGMGGVHNVGKGAHAKPRFIILQYNGASNSEKPYVIVGKTITFDTGGINLKPEAGLLNMHMDMSGGAAVIASLFLAERLKFKKNIIALIPAAENAVSGSSFRPGDIIKMYNGLTVQVNNTDAEGRLVVGDALAYAEKYRPQLVIDIASLTGAAWVALGYRASALFTKDEQLQRAMIKAGEESGDYLWPLPLWEEYEQELKTTFADLDNLGQYGRLGGAITAATFLYQFAKNFRWAHVDIGPRVTTYDGEYLAKGAYGSGVRLLINVLQNIK